MLRCRKLSTNAGSPPVVMTSEGVNMSRWVKEAAAVVAAVLAALQFYLPDGLTLAEIVNIVIAGVTALGVIVVNNGSYPYLKGAVAFLGAGLVVLASSVSDNVVTAQEW